METETKLIARYAETDQMGIVHHSNYPIWFEVARMDFLRKSGMSNVAIEEKGVLIPLTHMECSFKSPAKFEDSIVIKTKIRKMTCARIEFEYVVLNEKSTNIVAVGSTSHGWTNKELKPVNINKVIPELCSLLS